MNDFTEAALVLSPVAVGIVEVAKRAGLPTRWAPAFALVAGVVLALLAAWGDVLGGFEGNWARVVLTGMVVGLTASGLYSGVKTTARR
jgi:uncharacterized membrane protein (DUF441 family)